MKRYFPLALLTLLTACSNFDKNKADKSYFTTWEHYLGDPERTHYSNLNQIDTANVSQLKLAWSYKSGGLQEGRTTQIQTSPLMVDGVLYGVNAAIELFALDATTGKEIWKFSPKTKDESGLGLNRGLNYWKSDGEHPGRIFFSSGPKLYAVDIITGEPISSFGNNGSIDLREGLGRDPSKLSVVSNTPGAVFQNILIQGTRVGEGPGSSPGHIRAYDVLTGEILWTSIPFHSPGNLVTIPGQRKHIKK